MSYLSTASHSAAVAILGQPLTRRGARVREITQADVVAISSSTQADALVTIRAGLTESSTDGVAPTAAAIALVATAAAAVFALYPVEPVWVGVAGATLVAVISVIVALVAFANGPRTKAWCYLLDHRIGQMSEAAGGGHHNWQPTASFRGTFAPSLMTVVRRAEPSEGEQDKS